MYSKLLLAAFLLFAKPSYGQNDSARMADQLLKLEQRLTDALPGDSLTWAKYLDPHWYLTSEDGSGQYRKEFLAGFSPFPKGISGRVEVTHPVFAIHGNIAVIHYVADEYETVYGQQLHTTYGTVDTWYRTDTSWMMLSMLSFEIPALPPAIKLDRSVLQKYTGTYRLTQGHLAMITLVKDTLYMQKNKSKPEALFAETSNIFFRKSDARGRKFFVRDDQGKMAMLERRNGQDLVWKKIR